MVFPCISISWTRLSRKKKSPKVLRQRFSAILGPKLAKIIGKVPILAKNANISKNFRITFFELGFIHP